MAYRIGELLHHWTREGPQGPRLRRRGRDPGPPHRPGRPLLRATPTSSTAGRRTAWSGTDGEAFHPNLDPQPFDAIFLKGEHTAAYSGFEGRSADGTPLADWLRRHGVTHVDVCGLATDYCVRATTLDAVREGFTVRLLTNLTAGVAENTTKNAIEEVRSAGAVLV